MNLIKSFSTFAFFNILNAAIPFLLIPVLTKYLSPADYGILTNIDVFARFTLPFIILGVNGAINTAYFKSERQEFPLYVSSGVFVSFLSSILFFVIFLFFHIIIGNKLEIPSIWLIIIPFYCFFQGITQILLGIFQVSKKAFHYGIYQVSLTAVNIGLSVLLIVYFDMNWSGRLLGLIITYCLFMGIAIIYLVKNKLLLNRYSKANVIDILKFGIPLLPHLIAGPLIQFSDRLLITSFVGNAANGLYTVAFQIGTSIALITVAFNQAWVPHVFEQLGKADFNIKKRIVQQSYLLMLAFVGLAVLLFFATPFIFKWFIGAEFIDSQQYVFLISLGSVFAGMYFLVTNYIFYEKKTYILSWVTVANGIFSVALNYFLIQKYGAWGASITFLVTNFLLFISVWILSNRVYPMPWFYFLKQAK